MEFPRLVFKSPGPFKCNGGTYGHVPVKDASEYDAACAAGYSPTVPAALSAAPKPKAVVVPLEPVAAPPPAPPKAKAPKPRARR